MTNYLYRRPVLIKVLSVFQNFFREIMQDRSNIIFYVILMEISIIQGNEKYHFRVKLQSLELNKSCAEKNCDDPQSGTRL